MINDSCAGMSVKDFLFRVLGFSAAAVKRVKYREPGILLNGETVTVRSILKPGDILSLAYEDREEDDIVCVAVNVFWEPIEVTLPDLPEGRSWHLYVSTGGEERGMAWKRVAMRPRTVAVLSAESF